jgi:Flp pilus assembly pilin Flp
MKLSLVGTWMRKRLASRRGQNTVEYLLMLTVVVGVVLVAGVALKKFMPTLFNNIQQMITGAASQMGSGGN